MRLLVFIFILFSFNSLALDKDWTLDPKTSTLIPNYMGKVKVIRGKAKVEERELEKGSKVYVNELVKTEDKTALVLELIDMTTITLGPNSEFKVEKWAFKTKNDRDAVFSVIKGQCRTLVINKAKAEEQLQVKTPQVSMGIRGTELLVNVLKNKNKDITQVALLEGEIHLYPEGTMKEQNMHPGDYAVIIKDEKGQAKENRTLTAAEKKSFTEMIEPDLPKLLDPIVLNDIKSDTSNTEMKNSDLKKSEEDLKELLKNPSSGPTFKEKLKELNNAWARKKK